MHFAQPDNLYWLLVLVPMAGAAVWYGFWQRRVRDEIGDAGLVEQMAGSRSTTLRLTRIGLMLLGVALLCIAAAQPQWGRVQTNVEQEGIDVVFALDLSKSMLARDVPPTRLQAASDEIEAILDRLSGDRAGMVVFTTASFVQSPLTTDYGALRFYLDKLDPQQMSVGGTAVGGALRDSVELLTGESLGETDDSSAIKNARMDRAENQLVVLMTDGEDHQTDPVAAAGTARERGVHIVTIGVGTEDGAKIPVLDSDGEVRGYKRDDGGEPVRTSLRGSQLREVAEAGGGIYMAYEGDGSAADRVLKFIDQLQTSRFDQDMATEYHDRFLWFLAPGLLALIGSLVLGERRRGRFGWSRRAADVSVLLLVAAAAVANGGCEEAFRSQPHAVERGHSAIDDGDYEAALEAFDRAESELTPPPPVLFYNRGLAELGTDAPEKARSSFARALESPDASVRVDAHLNVGLSFAHNEEWKSALEEFESAFRLAQEHPDAIDEKALAMLRHNTELAYFKLYPPCRIQEDDHEDNDQPESATRLDKPTAEALTLCGLDDDWFVVDASPGARVEIEATFERLGEHRDPAHTFLPNRDDLKLEVYGAAGEARIAADHGEADADGDPPKKGPVTRDIEAFEVDESMPLGDSSRLLVRVAAADKLEFSYDLNIDVQPPCRALEDDAEENDSPEQAASIDDGAHRMQLCPGDPDWFQIDAEMGDSVFVDVRPMQRKGPKGGGKQGRGAPRKQSNAGPKLDPDKLSLEMIDADSGESVDDARREGPYLTAGVHTVDSDHSFKVGLTTADADNRGPYRLRVYVYPPCVVGDDRFEENDELDERTKLPKKKRHHRYLRLCPDDPDFYAARPSAPRQSPGRAGRAPGGAGASGGSQDDEQKSLELGLQRVAPEESKDGEIAIEALDPDTSEVVTSGRPPGNRGGSGGDDSAQQETSETSRFDRILQVDETQKDEIPVRVSGDPTFYHLAELPEGQNNSSRRQNQNQNQDGQKQNQDQDRRDRESNDERKQSDRKQQQQEDEREDNREASSGEREETESKQKSVSQKRMEDILEALEDSDTNFQMRNALEDEERERNIEKDW